MSDAFSNGASAVAYISVAGTATSSSYNFLRDFANAPQELQALLDTFDVAQTSIEAFQTTLTQVRNVGLVVGNDAWKALKLATDVANEVNIFLSGLRDGGDTNLTLWKKLEVAIKQKDILRYSEKLQNATVHILAVQQTICCGFQLKLLGLSQANAAALTEVRDNAASAESVSKLSTEVNEISQALSASITALGSDIQTSIHQASTEIKSRSATKADLLTLAEKLDQATLGLESEIKALLDIELITRRFLTVDQDIAGLRAGASGITNTIVAIASKLDSLGQGLVDVKLQIPAANETLRMLDRLETLAVDMAVVKSATVDKLWIMQEKLQRLARAMENQEGISEVAGIKASDSTELSPGNIHSNANATSVEPIIESMSGSDVFAAEGSQARAIAEPLMEGKENDTATKTSLNSRTSSLHSPNMYNSYPGMELQPKLGGQGGSGGQHHIPKISKVDDTEDSEGRCRAPNEKVVSLDAPHAAADATNCLSPITQDHQELSSDNRTSSTSSFTSLSSIASMASIFSLVSSSSMSSVDSHLGLDSFARLLTEDSIIMPLCNKAVAIYGHERFERSLRRLLLKFSSDLVAESASSLQKAAARCIRLRARKTAYIVAQSVRYMEKQESPREFELPIKDSRTFTLHENLSFDETLSDNSESDDDFDIDLSEFERLGEYMATSKAIQKLRENLRLLVYPNTKPTIVKDIATTMIHTTGPKYDPFKYRPGISSEYLPGTEPSIMTSLDSREEPLDCDRVLAVEDRLGVYRWQQKIGLKTFNNILHTLAQPICQTYRIWLPAVIGGWLGYMLHEFRNGEQREESLPGSDAA